MGRVGKGGFKRQRGRRAAESSLFRTFIPPQVPPAWNRGTCGGIVGTGGAARAAQVDFGDGCAGFTAQAAAQGL